MKKLYIALLGTLLALLLAFGIWSLVDMDATVSVTENRKLAAKPKFSLSSLFDGSYISALETYYSDTFPLRDSLLKVNKSFNRFYYYSGSGDDNLLILGNNTGADQGGESLAQAQTPETNPTPDADETPDAPAVPAITEPEKTEPEKTEPETPPLDDPSEDSASYAGNVVIVGDRAMEIPTATNSIIESYAQAVNNLAKAMGDSVRTISLVTPNGGEFYSPVSMHTGDHSQKDMIDLCYGAMDDSIVTVDAYSALREHVNDYIFFRTDHHWTALGAYYAYTKFCQAAGFEAVELDKFQTGTYSNFVGSMYTYTSGYPQSEILQKNPDTLTYYLPIPKTHAKYYADATLTDGIAISVVYTKLDESVSNKYLCFIGGDNPVCVIETDVDGPTCIVLKESYGNAFSPFLTSHYGKIIVIDPREFNRDGKPSLDLAAFAKEQQVDDLIVINYPYMINSSNYVTWLNRLVGADATQ